MKTSIFNKRLDQYIKTYFPNKYSQYKDNNKFSLFHRNSGQIIKLNHAEQLFIVEYVEGYSEAINSKLRNSFIENKTSTITKVKEYHFLFHQILQKIDTKNHTKNGFLYRGLKLSNRDYNKFILESDTFSDTAYLSTTNSLSSAGWFVAEDSQTYPAKDYVFILFKIKKYSTAIPIYGYTGKSVDGKEHLFLPNTKFKITENIKLSNEQMKSPAEFSGGVYRDVQVITLEEII